MARAHPATPALPGFPPLQCPFERLVSISRTQSTVSPCQTQPTATTSQPLPRVHLQSDNNRNCDPLNRRLRLSTFLLFQKGSATDRDSEGPTDPTPAATWKKAQRSDYRHHTAHHSTPADKYNIEGRFCFAYRRRFSTAALWLARRCAARRPSPITAPPTSSALIAPATPSETSVNRVDPPTSVHHTRRRSTVRPETSCHTILRLRRARHRIPPRLRTLSRA